MEGIPSANTKIKIMKYNSIHRFDDLDDAVRFTKTITRDGFSFVRSEKEGGNVYSNGKHEMLVYVSK